MENLNLSKESPKNNTELNGRETISVDEALAIQIKLIEYMIPSELKSDIEADDSGKIMDELASRWLEKYAKKFAEYCNLSADDQDLMDKITNNELTEEDLRSIIKFLEQESEDGSGGPFFTSKELREFIVQNTQ